MRNWAYSLAIPAFLLFIVLAFTYEKWTVLDTWAAEWLYGNRFVGLFHYIGETKIVIGIATVFILLFLIRKKSSKALLVFVAIGGNFGINQAVKHIIDRPRPDMEGQLTSFSFPSGHTMASLTLCILLAYLCTRYVQQSISRRFIWVAMLLLAVGAGLSRIAEGRHFFTDVLAGWGLAFTWIILVIYLFERPLQQQQ